MGASPNGLLLPYTCTYYVVSLSSPSSLFDSTLCDVFSFLDATRRVVVVVLRRRRLRRRRCHQKHAIPWCDCPLGTSPNGLFSFYLYCTHVVNVAVVDTPKTFIPWCDRPFGPSPNGGFPRLASLPCRTLRHGSRLKTTVCRRTTFVFSLFSFQLCRRSCRPCRPRLDALLLRRLSFSFSTRLDVPFVLVFVVVVLCCTRRAPLPLEPTLRLHRSSSSSSSPSFSTCLVFVVG